MKIVLKYVAVFAVCAMTAGVVNAQQVITTGDAPIAIPDNTDLLDACQTITVASEMITDLEVEVSMTHTWIGDLVVQLNHPNGSTSLTVFSKPGTNTDGAGDSSNLDGAPLRFHDAGVTDAELMGSTIGTDDLVCTTDGLCDYFPNPDTSAIIPSVGVNLADFNGLDAAGDWTLCVGDTAGGDIGNLESWTIGVNAAVPVDLQSFTIN